MDPHCLLLLCNKSSFKHWKKYSKCLICWSDILLFLASPGTVLCTISVSHTCYFFCSVLSSSQKGGNWQILWMWWLIYKPSLFIHLVYRYKNLSTYWYTTDVPLKLLNYYCYLFFVYSAIINIFLAISCFQQCCASWQNIFEDNK